MTTIQVPYDLEYASPQEGQPIALSSPRPASQPLWYLPSVLLGALSWNMGGVAFFNDLAMALLMIASAVGVLRELRNFRRDIGIGGLVLFGGSIVWFCHDYFFHWAGGNYGADEGVSKFIVGHEYVGKGAFLVSLFMLCAAFGLRIQKGRRLEKLMSSVPEPTPNTYLVIVILTFLIGLVMPYMLFQEDSFLVALGKDMISMRSGDGSRWTIGRTGNLNFSWSAYILHFLQLAQVGAILGACYAALMAKNAVAKVICWTIWAIHVGLAFGTGSRGPLLAMTLPVVMVVVLRGWIFGNASKRSVTWGAAGMLLVLAAAQYQGTFRNSMSADRSLQEMELFKAQGNLMFSEPLPAYQMVPAEIPHPGDRFAGAQFIRPLPEIAFRFGTGWIPRALWKTKPATLGELLGLGGDSFFAEYNRIITGGTATNTEEGGNVTGGTVATSIVGMGYIPYGVPGVIQYAVLFGWLCAVSERVLRKSEGRLMALLFALGFATYLFRAFRDLTPHDLYPLVIGTLGASILIKLISPKRENIAPDEVEYDR